MSDNSFRSCLSILGFAAVIAVASYAQAQSQTPGGTGCYSDASAQAASNACGEGGAPGAVGPSAAVPAPASSYISPSTGVAPPPSTASVPVITGTGCYSGQDAQAASNACGEGGAPRGPVGPSATQR